MKKKTILIVPPRGIAVKAFKIRLSVAIIFIIFILCGFAGYFIPFNSFTLDIVEQNQKKNLSEQNKALLQKILSTLKLLNNLKDQVARLDQKRHNVLGFGGIVNRDTFAEKLGIDFDKLEPDELLRYVENKESRFQALASTITEKDNLFDRVPVIRPVPEPFIISRVFGASKDPFTAKDKWHYGIDFIAEESTPVFSTASGIVSKVENHPVWGRRVVIDHGGEFSTIYAHLGKTEVKKGKRVDRGDVIGVIGMSGLSTGPHIHYEIWKNGAAVNPEDYFFPTERNK